MKTKIMIDYTKKAAELSARILEYTERLRLLDAEASDRHAFFQFYVQLEICDQHLLGIREMDLAKIKEADPERYRELMGARRRLRKARKSAQIGLEFARDEMKKMNAENWRRRTADARAILEREIPGWCEKLYSKILKYAEKHGISRPEAPQILEAPLTKMIRKAMLFDGVLNENIR